MIRAFDKNRVLYHDTQILNFRALSRIGAVRRYNVPEMWRRDV